MPLAHPAAPCLNFSARRSRRPQRCASVLILRFAAFGSCTATVRSGRLSLCGGEAGMAGRRAVEVVLTDAERAELRGPGGPALDGAGDGAAGTDRAGLRGRRVRTRRWRPSWACASPRSASGGRGSPSSASRACATSLGLARPARWRTSRVEALVTATLESVPKDATHWSSRGMARASAAVGVHRAAHLAGVRLAAAPAGDVQALDRS